MRYLVDNMFNGLVKELAKQDIECDTVIHEIWDDIDSAKKGRYDAKIFRFLLEKKYNLSLKEKPIEDYTIITADKDLERYCKEFGVDCFHISQPKPLSRPEYKALAARLSGQLEKKAQRLSQKTANG